MDAELTRDLERFLGVLRQEADTYHRLLRLATQQTHLVVSRDLPALEELTARQEEELNRLRGLDFEAREAFLDLALPPGMTLDQALEEGLDPSRREEFSWVRADLSETAQALKKTNRFNAELVRNGLEYARHFLTCLSQMATSSPAYSPSGGARAFSAPVAISGFG